MWGNPEGYINFWLIRELILHGRSLSNCADFIERQNQISLPAAVGFILLGQTFHDGQILPPVVGADGYRVAKNDATRDQLIIGPPGAERVVRRHRGK